MNTLKSPPPVTRTAAVLLGLLVLGTTLVDAAPSPKSKETRGIIQSVDAATHTVVLTVGKAGERTFKWDEHTRFSLSGRPAEPAALRPGEPVHVTYPSGGTPPVLQNVRLSPPHPTSAKAGRHAPAQSGHSPT